MEEIEELPPFLGRMLLWAQSFCPIRKSFPHEPLYRSDLSTQQLQQRGKWCHWQKWLEHLEVSPRYKSFYCLIWREVGIRLWSFWVCIFIAEHEFIFWFLLLVETHQPDSPSTLMRSWDTNCKSQSLLFCDMFKIKMQNILLHIEKDINPGQFSVFMFYKNLTIWLKYM